MDYQITSYIFTQVIWVSHHSYLV